MISINNKIFLISLYCIVTLGIFATFDNIPPSISFISSAITFSTILVLKNKKVSLNQLPSEKLLFSKIVHSLCLTTFLFSITQWPISQKIQQAIIHNLDRSAQKTNQDRSEAVKLVLNNSILALRDELSNHQSMRDKVEPTNIDNDGNGNKIPPKSDPGSGDKLQKIEHLLAQLKELQNSAQPSNEDPGKVRDEINAWGTMFSWLLALGGLTIAFVTNWVYNIAKDTQQQAERVNTALNLDCTLRKAQSDIAMVDIQSEIFFLYNYFDIEDQHNERDCLLTIRDLLCATNALLKPMADLKSIHDTLDSGLIKLKDKLDIINKENLKLDQLYTSFVRTDFPPLLEELHSKLLNENHLILTETGRACLDNVAAFSRFVRNS